MYLSLLVLFSLASRRLRFGLAQLRTGALISLWCPPSAGSPAVAGLTPCPSSWITTGQTASSSGILRRCMARLVPAMHSLLALRQLRSCMAYCATRGLCLLVLFRLAFRRLRLLVLFSLAFRRLRLLVSQPSVQSL